MTETQGLHGAVGFHASHVADEIGRKVAELAEYRDRVARAAEANVGLQAGYRLSAMGRKLSIAVTELEGGLLRLRDALADPGEGMAISQAIGQAPPTAGQPVHGSFEIYVAAYTTPFTLAADAKEQMTVWPGKPIVQVLNDALVLLGLEQQAGVWSLHTRNGAIQELSVGDARIEPGDTLFLRREGAAT